MESMVKKNKNYWINKNILITGCTGFLGSWLTKILLDKGANITGLVRDWVPESNLIIQDSISKINVVKGDVEDYFLLERILNEYEIEVVFHLAAQAIVGTANRNPKATFETNIRGTWNLLEACRRSSTVKKTIIASSDKAYGEHSALPYTEELPLRGSHPYDVSKSCADLIASTYYSTYKLPVCISRCGNFYGGGDLNFNRIIPGTIQSVLKNERPIIRSDGKFIRDYLYVIDVVDAYLLLAEKMENKKIHGEAFNFSGDVQLTVIEVVNNILNIMNRKDLEPVILNEAKAEIKNQYLSIAKAKEILGWNPQYNLEEGLKETVEWYRRFLG